MRRVAPLLAVALLAACGGGGKTGATVPATTASAPPTVTGPQDPGRDTVEAFVAAARSADATRLWELLSTSSRERLGPSLAAFRKTEVPALAGTVGRIRDFRTVVSERVTPEFGIVAIDGRRGSGRALYAAVLRLEGSSWKVELGGPAVVRPIGPDPGAREPVVGQIAAEVEGPGGTGTAVMYLDGHTENPKIYVSAKSATMVANFEPPLDAGRHTVVVFASDGRDASATAWAFTVTG